MINRLSDKETIALGQQLYRDDLDARDVMVSVHCITYNHEAFIRDALEGFVMQQTDFRFEVIVHDDASTDGTAKIIAEYAEKYPSIIKPIYEKENLYSRHDGSLSRVMNAHMRGKYIAFCEGDDYWTDPLKLQKQVDFLEANPDYGLVCSNHKALKQSTQILYPSMYNGPLEIDFSDLIMRNLVTTLTVCIRSEIFINYNTQVCPPCQWKCGDYPLWLFTASNFKIKRISDETGVYRILPISASHLPTPEKRAEMAFSDLSIINFFINANAPKLSKATKKKAVIDVTNRTIERFFEAGHKEGLKYAQNLCLKNGLPLHALFLTLSYHCKCFRGLWHKLHSHNFNCGI